MVTCDGLFQSCEVTTWSKDPEKDCAYCAGASSNIYSALGLETVQLRAGLKPDDRQMVAQWVESLSPENYSTAVFEHSTYGKLEIGRWCTSSVFSYFRITAAQLARPDVRALHRKYLANSLITYLATARICDQFQPTHGFIFNCRMAPFRTAYELLRSRNVPVTGHERGVADGTFVFS